MGAKAAMVEAGNNIVSCSSSRKFRRNDYADTTIGVYDKFIVDVVSRNFTSAFCG